MGRKYTAPIDALSLAQSAAVELWFVAAPSDAAVLLHELVVTQEASETSEQLPLEIFRTATDQSAKGSAITPAPLEVGDPAFGGTVRSNILTGDTFATKTTLLYRMAQNVLGGWHVLWTPETRPVLSPSGRLVVKLPTGPGAALTISGYLVLEELGG